jgi:hypothetical protein
MSIEQIKYLIDGSQVSVIEKTSSGYLVAGIYSGEEYGEEIRMDTDPFFAEHVFDEAPTQAFDNRILGLHDKIRELESKRDELLQMKRDSETESKRILDSLARFDKLKLLLDFIDEKITHYVTEDYSGLSIIEFTDTVCDGDRNESNPSNRKLKLLSLFGESNGDLQWKLSRYRDGSGMYSDVFPCCSLEEAVLVLRERLLASLNIDRPNPRTVEVADKYGIDIPVEYRDVVRKSLISNIEKQIADNASKTAQLEAQKAALK